MIEQIKRRIRAECEGLSEVEKLPYLKCLSIVTEEWCSYSKKYDDCKHDEMYDSNTCAECGATFLGA